MDIELIVMRKACLDLTVMKWAHPIFDLSSADIDFLRSFMKEWFPKEVKAKQKENDEEIVKEQAQATGMDTRCCIM